MKKLIVFVFLVPLLALSQLSVVNPSFEGNPAPDITPAPWQVCGGTPDTQPGQFGVSNPPSHGNTYLGIQAVEGATQKLSSAMVAGKNYLLNLDLAYGSYLASPVRGELCIYGGYAKCEQSQLLWSSEEVSIGMAWTRTTASLTPTQNFTYLSFIKCGPIHFSNVLVDNMGEIRENTELSSLAFLSKTDVCISECANLTAFASGGAGAPYTFEWTSRPAGFTSSAQNPGTVCPTQTTTYILTVTDDSSNTFIDSVTLNVHALPNANAGPDTDVCSGSQVQLNASGGAEYLWTPSFGLSSTKIANPKAFPSKTTEFKVKVTSAKGCVNYDSLVVQVKPLAYANFDYTKNDLDLEFFASDANGIFEYIWDFGDRSPKLYSKNVTHHYEQQGNYTITLIVTNSCRSDTLQYEITVDGQSGSGSTGGSPNGVAEELQLQNVKLFPNPAQNTLNIALEENVKGTLYVFNYTGALVKSQEIRERESAIDISVLKEGVYLLQILSSDSKTYSTLFTKE